MNSVCGCPHVPYTSPYFKWTHFLLESHSSELLIEIEFDLVLAYNPQHTTKHLEVVLNHVRHPLLLLIDMITDDHKSYSMPSNGRSRRRIEEDSDSSDVEDTGPSLSTTNMSQTQAQQDQAQIMLVCIMFSIVDGC